MDRTAHLSARKRKRPPITVAKGKRCLPFTKGKKRALLAPKNLPPSFKHAYRERRRALPPNASPCSANGGKEGDRPTKKFLFHREKREKDESSLALSPDE